MILEPGTVIAERFELAECIGCGGMGTVHRAVDRASGHTVAVKVLTSSTPALLERFAREGRMLAKLRHPAIVRHLAHGTLDSSGLPFIAMAWLEGEDLASRLVRAPLTPAQSLTVARRVAEALAHAHRVGVIHRDIKPSNLFLVKGEPARLAVLDFGVARPLDTTQPPLTRTGALVGTVGYIAPEQAQGARSIDARADLFSLGCVMYECLTGRPAFQGRHPMALLASLLLEDPPRVREVRADLPPAIDALVARLLAKDADERPRDAEAFLRDLDAIGSPTGAAPTERTWADPRSGERPMVNVVLMQLEPGPHEPGLMERIAALAGPFGAEVARLGDGPIVALMRRNESAATDRAVLAASMALALAHAFPEARIALTTGRAGTAGGMPLGPGIEIAMQLTAAARPGRVRLDAVTESLLDPRFEVRDGVLVDEHTKGDVGVRMLLGRPTPCVGRRKELRLLRDAMDECVEESFAQVVLVTAPAGTGKSRLRHELLRTLDARAWRVLEARAHPVGAGSAFTLVRQLIEGAFGHRGTSPDDLARVLSELELEDPEGVAEFLAEILGTGGKREPSPQLRVARNDARLMAEWMGRAVVSWLGGELRRAPVLVVIEDLHWGDVVSVTYLARALAEHRDQGFMLLALARPEPELSEALVRAWSGGHLQRLALSGLSRRAAERLVREVLGHDTPDDEVEQIVTRADGNAFFLEELIRHAAEGSAALPETVLAMVEARLQALNPETRRAAQIAAVFGERLPRAGLEALAELDDAAAVDELIERELFQPTAARELVFQHALVRDAAYAMMAPEVRRWAHDAVAQWLESRGGADPLVIIEHYEAAGRPEAAVPAYVEATRRTYLSGDMDGTIAVAARGRDAGATGVARGELSVWAATATSGMQRYAPAVALAREAIALLPKGSASWYFALGIDAYASQMIGERAQDDLQQWGDSPLPSAIGVVGHAHGLVMPMLVHTEQRDEAKRLLARMQRASTLPDADLIFSTWLESASVYVSLFIDDDPLAAHEAALRGVTSSLSAGDRTMRALCGVWEGAALLSLGRPQEAITWLEDSLSNPIAPTATYRYGDGLIGHGYVELGRLDEALEAAQRLLDSDTRGAPELAEWSLRASASIALGRAAETIPGLQAIIQAPPPATASQGMACLHSALADAYLACGRTDEALAQSRIAMALVPRSITPYLRSTIHRIHAEALLAQGERDEAYTVLRVATERLRRIAHGLPAEHQDAVATGLASHRRLLALAEQCAIPNIS